MAGTDRAAGMSWTAGKAGGLAASRGVSAVSPPTAEGIPEKIFDAEQPGSSAAINATATTRGSLA